MKTNRLVNASALLLLLLSCSSPMEVKTLDLDTVNDDFNASAFFQKKLDRTNKTIATEPSKTDKKELLKQLDDNMFVKDTLCYYTSEYTEGKHISGKSDYINRDKTPEGIYGYTYKTVAWDENDSLAVLNGVYFQKLDILEGKDGKFLSLNAMNGSKTNQNYTQLITHLTKKYGKPTTLLENKAKQFEILNWETATDIVQLRTKIDTVENILSIALDGTKEIKVAPKYTLDYFKINKKELKVVKELKGDRWYYIKEEED